MRNVERWWDPVTLDFLRRLKGAIDAAFSKRSKCRSPLLIAFCNTLIKASNAAFNHQSLSFKSVAQAPLAPDCNLPELFARSLDFVLDGAAQNPAGRARALQADARCLAPEQVGNIDCVIISPPYANRMSYFRELRPYTYWLGYLLNGRDAGEMDWEAIGGAWGVATSRLNDWAEPQDGFQSASLQAAAGNINRRRTRTGGCRPRTRSNISTTCGAASSR